MNRMIAYCGLVCTDCRAYIAAQSDDRAALEAIASQWRQRYNRPDITVSSVLCDSCLAQEGRKCGYCATCEIRSCAVERNVINCAQCTEFASPS